MKLLFSIFLSMYAVGAFAQMLTSAEVFDEMNPTTSNKFFFTGEGAMYVKFWKIAGPLQGYTSTDKGLTWRSLDLDIVDSLKIELDPWTDMAGARFQDAHMDVGLTISFDQGKSWKELRKPKSIYASKKIMRDIRWDSWGIVTNGQGTIFYATELGVNTTTDYGKTWSRSPFWKKFAPSKGNSYWLRGLTADSEGHLFCGINVIEDKEHKLLKLNNGRAWNAHGFYIVRSTDDGKTWDYASEFIAPDSGVDHCALLELELDRTGNMFAVTTNALLRSTDGGKTFTKISEEGFDDVYDILAKDPDGNIWLMTATGKVKGVRQLSQ